MKKCLCTGLLLLALCLPFSGVAEETAVLDSRRMMTLSGAVVAGETKVVQAPFGGTIKDVALRAGDIVAAGDILFEIETKKIYAPCDGVVGSVGAQVGDDVAYIQERYGALLYIEPKSRLLIQTDTTYAYNTGDNYLIHVGETVYIGSRNSSERAGVGFVTTVDGGAYTVEVTDGNLIMGDGVSIFRQADFASDSKIGSGTITSSANVSITTEGSIFALHVEQGDTVRRGDLLVEIVDGDLLYNHAPTNKVMSGYAGIVATVEAGAGNTVSDKQTLATIYPSGSLQVAVEVSESDLRNLRIGDLARIELAGFYDQEPMAGTVASISGLDTGSEETETRYTVYIDFNAANEIRLGMSANVYINE